MQLMFSKITKVIIDFKFPSHSTFSTHISLDTNSSRISNRYFSFYITRFLFLLLYDNSVENKTAYITKRQIASNGMG